MGVSTLITVTRIQRNDDWFEGLKGRKDTYAWNEVLSTPSGLTKPKMLEQSTDEDSLTHRHG